MRFPKQLKLKTLWVTIFKAFPLSVLGAMLLFAGIELGRIAFQIKGRKETFIMLLIGVLSVIINLAVGFFAGLLLFLLLKKVNKL
jgi:SulP family sulfate permease